MNLQPQHTLTGHSDRVSSAKFFNGAQNVVTGSRDRTLKLWDLKKDCCLRTLFAGSSATDVIVSDASGKFPDLAGDCPKFSSQDFQIV